MQLEYKVPRNWMSLFDSLVISELTRSRTVRDAEGREVVAVMTVMGRLGGGRVGRGWRGYVHPPLSSV